MIVSFTSSFLHGCEDSHHFGNHCRKVAISLLSCYELISLVCTLLRCKTCVVITHFAEVILRVITKYKNVDEEGSTSVLYLCASAWDCKINANKPPALYKTIQQRVNELHKLYRSWSDSCLSNAFYLCRSYIICDRPFYIIYVTHKLFAATKFIFMYKMYHSLPWW